MSVAEREARLAAAREVAKDMLPDVMPAELKRREEMMYFLVGGYEGALFKLGWEIHLKRIEVPNAT
jgi:hypothetical protein